MCGRFACGLGAGELTRLCHFRNGSRRSRVKWLNEEQEEHYCPSYNYAPGDVCAALVSSSSGYARNFVDEQEDEMIICIAQMEFGTILKSGNLDGRRIINARAETIGQKPLFRRPLCAGQRCVIVADGFYEWVETKHGKQPYFIYLPADKVDTVKLLPMAGLYFLGAAGPPCFVIITVDAAPSIRHVHDRMPVVLSDDEATLQWLNCDHVPTKEAINLLTTNCNVQCYTVSKNVNNPKHNDPLNTQPLDKLSDAGSSQQTSLNFYFSPTKSKLQP